MVVHGIEQLRVYQGCGRGQPIGKEQHLAGEVEGSPVRALPLAALRRKRAGGTQLRQNRVPLSTPITLRPCFDGARNFLSRKLTFLRTACFDGTLANLSFLLRLTGP